MKPGDRVMLHPATDYFMRGARYGTVVTDDPDGIVVVRLDATARKVRFRAEDVLPV